jgi:hypothetical protein
VLFEHIVLDFLYYIFNCKICKGDIYFWEREAAIIIISIILLLSKKYKDKIKTDDMYDEIFFFLFFIRTIYYLYITLFNNFIDTFAFIFILLTYIVMLIEYIFLVNKNLDTYFYLSIFFINISGLLMCQKILPMKEIPDTFKYRKVDPNVRKFVLKSRFK